MKPKWVLWLVVVLVGSAFAFTPATFAQQKEQMKEKRDEMQEKMKAKREEMKEKAKKKAE